MKKATDKSGLIMFLKSNSLWNKQTALYELSSGRNRCLICEPIETKKLTHVIYAQIFNIASCEQKRTKNKKAPMGCRNTRALKV
jgi:hypothetical protein